MKLRLVLAVFLSMLFSGCASITYHRTDAAAGDTKITEIARAPSAVKPVGILPPAKLTKLVIDGKASPVFVQGDVESRFELLELTGKKDQPFTINIVASCDCFGFSKRAMAPVTYLLDGTGKVVVNEQPEKPVNDVYYKMSKTLQGTFPADGVYYVAVVADYHGARNVRVGDAVGYVGGAEFKLPIYQYPTGSAMVIWVLPKGAAKDAAKDPAK